ncbi:MAG: ketopantoate reductase family protein [Campylobacteraceae bacterium]|nr:ketopantoate reductase family protein [Campylobacteraceae bacterium]
MKFVILGAGGIGCYYGARLLDAGYEVIFVARGKHLSALKSRGLELKHPDFSFLKPVDATDMQGLMQRDIHRIDAILIAAKSTATREIAQNLAQWFKQDNGATPYCISLQNGVENEDILGEFIDKNFIIGGLTRKVGAHIIEDGVVEAVGCSQTIVGLLDDNPKAKAFLEKLSRVFQQASIPLEITHDMRKELWKKLIINNGVNALCALLGEKTGVLLHHPKLSKVVYGLMLETAKAAQSLHVNILKEDIDAMYALILGFESIKPSMLVDVEHGRALEIEEICGVVLRVSELCGLDAPYTRAISSLLEFKLEQKNR